MSGFDTDHFLDWLDEQPAPVPQERVVDEWPDFPWTLLDGVTCSISESGGLAYYKVDLRDAARGRRSRD